MINKLLEDILKKEGLFVPWVFTKKQFNILKKRNANMPLSNAEKKSLYTSIKKKMGAMESLSRGQKDIEYWINGPNEIMPSRLFEAKKLLDEYSRKYDKVFISGSFLFSKKFEDIDVFIIKERGYKEALEGNKHLIFLTEKRLRNPIFQSASLISVSNFAIPRKMRRKKPSLHELMATYHEAVIERLRKEKKPESLRRLIFDYNLFCNNRLLNGKELNAIAWKMQPSDIDGLIKGLCTSLFSRKYLYVEIHSYIKTLEESIKNIKPNAHLLEYINTYEEMIYGRQRSKAEIA